MESGRKGDIYNIDIQRVSYAKHKRSKKKFKNYKKRKFDYTRLVISKTC